MKYICDNDGAVMKFAEQIGSVETEFDPSIDGPREYILYTSIYVCPKCGAEIEVQTEVEPPEYEDYFIEDNYEK